LVELMLGRSFEDMYPGDGAGDQAVAQWSKV
jgi:hypothetical protein